MLASNNEQQNTGKNETCRIGDDTNEKLSEVYAVFVIFKTQTENSNILRFEKLSRMK